MRDTEKGGNREMSRIRSKEMLRSKEVKSRECWSEWQSNLRRREPTHLPDTRQLSRATPARSSD